MNFDTNTICKCSDIDIYLLYFIELEEMIKLTILSTEQYQIMHKQQFIKELFIINGTDFRKKICTLFISSFNIIDYASLDNYIVLIKYIYESVNEFKYTKNAINYASYNNHINILDWFAEISCSTDNFNSKYEFKYDRNTISFAAYNGARRRSR